MSRSWCIWCETGNESGREYFWIHPECFERLQDLNSLTRFVEENNKNLSEEFLEHYKMLKESEVKWKNFLRFLKPSSGSNDKEEKL